MKQSILIYKQEKIIFIMMGFEKNKKCKYYIDDEYIKLIYDGNFELKKAIIKRKKNKKTY